MWKRVLKRIGVVLFLVKGDSKFAWNYYKIVSIIFLLPFLFFGGGLLWWEIFPEADQPARPFFDSCLIWVSGLAFILGPLATLFLGFGFHVPVQKFYDRKYPPIVKSSQSSKAFTITCGVQQFGVLWSHMIYLPIFLLGAYSLVGSALGYAGVGSVKDRHDLLKVGLLLTPLCGVIAFYRNIVIFDRKNEELIVLSGFLFFTRVKKKVKWRECNAIHISRRYEYRVTSAGQVELIVSESRPVAMMQKYFYSPLILETDSGDIEVKQFQSWWLATRLARKISSYTGIPIGSVSPRPDHQKGENIGGV